MKPTMIDAPGIHTTLTPCTPEDMQEEPRVTGERHSSAAQRAEGALRTAYGRAPLRPRGHRQLDVRVHRAVYRIVYPLSFISAPAHAYRIGKALPSTPSARHPADPEHDPTPRHPRRRAEQRTVAEEQNDMVISFNPFPTLGPRPDQNRIARSHQRTSNARATRWLSVPHCAQLRSCGRRHQDCSSSCRFASRLRSFETLRSCTRRATPRRRMLPAKQKCVDRSRHTRTARAEVAMRASR